MFITGDCCADYEVRCTDKGIQALKLANVSSVKFNYSTFDSTALSIIEKFVLARDVPNLINSGFECVGINITGMFGMSIWMKTTCADGFPELEQKRKCEQPNDTDDVLEYVHVVNGGVVFKNIYCAKCNGADKNITSFQPNFVCPPFVPGGPIETSRRICLPSTTFRLTNLGRA